MEKNIQAFFQTITAAAVLYGSSQLISLNTKIEVMSVQLKSVLDKSEIYVTKDYIDQRSKIRDLQVQQLDQRLTIVEKKVTK